jgi:hypothetical protein
MAALGDKIGSTILAQSAGVPTIPWSGDGVTIDYAGAPWGSVLPGSMVRNGILSRCVSMSFSWDQEWCAIKPALLPDCGVYLP